ncbi:MAG: MFS transporter [Nitriliruptorales bacterium]|nr:MFS transporter [Nitriliruptorales bacterium]
MTLGEGAIAVLVPPYLDSRGIDAGIIGAVLAGYGLAALAARVPAAAWYRQHRATLLVSGGCLVMAVSFALLPLTCAPLVIAVLVGLDGVGFAIATTATMAALMDRRAPGSEAGSIMGWYTGSLGLGYAAAGFVAGGVADALSVSTAIVVLAGIPAVAAVLFALALRAVPAVGAAPVAAPVPSRGRLAALASAPPTVWLRSRCACTSRSSTACCRASSLCTACGSACPWGRSVRCWGCTEPSRPVSGSCPVPCSGWCRIARRSRR